MTRTIVETRLAALCNSVTDDDLVNVLGLSPATIDRRRQGEGWRVSEAVRLAVYCRVRPAEIFRDPGADE